MSGASPIDDLIADFDLLDEWEDRYRYIMELGRDLPPFPDAARTEDNRVRGCASQVWLLSSTERDENNLVMRYQADSDALIVQGLVAIALRIFDGLRPEEVAATDANDLFRRLGLDEHLTAQRANGLRALVERIKAAAEDAATAA